jgi:hypothetical protein
MCQSRIAYYQLAQQDELAVGHELTDEDIAHSVSAFGEIIADFP